MFPSPANPRADSRALLQWEPEAVGSGGASDPARSSACGWDTSWVFSRSSSRFLESAHAWRVRRRVSGERLERPGWEGAWGKEAGRERVRGGAWVSFHLDGLSTLGQRVAEDPAGSKGRARAPGTPDCDSVSTLRSPLPLPAFPPPPPPESLGKPCCAGLQLT